MWERLLLLGHAGVLRDEETVWMRERDRKQHVRTALLPSPSLDFGQHREQTAPLVALILIPAVVLLFTTYLRRLRLHSLVFRWIQSLRMGLESLGFSVWPWSSSSSRLAGASGGSPDKRRKKKSTGSSSSSKSKSVRTRAEQVALQQLGKQNDTASYDDEDARHYAGLAMASLSYLQPHIDAIHAKAEALDVPTPVIDALQELFKTLNTPKTSYHSIRPHAIIAALSAPHPAPPNSNNAYHSSTSSSLFNSREHQDAQELFQLISECIKNELATVDWEGQRDRGIAGILELRKPFALESSGNLSHSLMDGSMIEARGPSSKSVFDGLTANRRSCVVCGYTEAVMHFGFDNWQLALPSLAASCRLEDCLEEYTRLEILKDCICRKCSVLATHQRLLREIETLEGAIGASGMTTTAAVSASGVFSSGSPLASSTSMPSTSSAKSKPSNSKKKRLKEVKRMESRVKTALTEGRIEDDSLLEGVRLERVVSPASTKQAMIARAPPVLALHLNRSLHYGQYASKNTIKIYFPEVLDLTAFTTSGSLSTIPTSSISTPSPSTSQPIAIPGMISASSSGAASSEPPRRSTTPTPQTYAPGHHRTIYRLAAVVCHYGQHSFGHYICYRRKPKRIGGRFIPPTLLDPLRLETEEEDNTATTTAKPPQANGSVPHASPGGGAADYFSAPRYYWEDGAEKEVGTGRGWLRISDDSVAECGIESVLAEGSGAFMLYYEKAAHPRPGVYLRSRTTSTTKMMAGATAAAVSFASTERGTVRAPNGVAFGNGDATLRGFPRYSGLSGAGGGLDGFSSSSDAESVLDMDSDGVAGSEETLKPEIKVMNLHGSVGSLVSEVGVGVRTPVKKPRQQSPSVADKDRMASEWMRASTEPGVSMGMLSSSMSSSVSSTSSGFGARIVRNVSTRKRSTPPMGVNGTASLSSSPEGYPSSSFSSSSSSAAPVKGVPHVNGHGHGHASAKPQRHDDDEDSMEMPLDFDMTASAPSILSHMSAAKAKASAKGKAPAVTPKASSAKMGVGSKMTKVVHQMPNGSGMKLASFKVPAIENEPMKAYAPDSVERKALQAALAEMEQALPFEVPIIVNGEEIRTGSLAKQPMPHDHKRHLCTYHEADEATVAKAIAGALAAKAAWESMPWNDRAAIFLKAADLVSGNRVEYRALEGFVLAVSPFNFTAIGGNLPGVPAMVGNVVVWKPSPMATYSNYLVHEILTEAGVPAGVIQFVPGPPAEVVAQTIAHPAFAALHFTGSTFVFRKLWKDIAANLDAYRSYPRIVGETGGKNFHIIHKSAEVRNAVLQSVRGAFEYQGQKCSATSRVYVAKSVWEQGGFKEQLLEEVAKLKVGPCNEWDNFLGPVMLCSGKPSFDRILSYIHQAKSAGGEVLIGGSGDDSKGYFVQPTVILTTDPKSVTMTEEIFGPVLTVYVYEDSKWEETLKLIDETTQYALTGSIFSRDRLALIQATNALRNAAGNVYYNEKCTGAVVGQQPFGGARGSGTNDKAGSVSIFYRFVSARSIKENFVSLEGVGYPSSSPEVVIIIFGVITRTRRDASSGRARDLRRVLIEVAADSCTFFSTTMQFSHHSSNPLEVHTSDPRNAVYRHHLANLADESSDELGRWSDKTTYQDHVSKVVGVDLSALVIPPFKGNNATPVAGPSRTQLCQEYVDLDEDMESDDELATPYKEDYVRTEQGASKNAHHIFQDEEIAMDEQAGDAESTGQEGTTLTHEEEAMEEDEEQTYIEEVWENDIQPEEYVDISDEDAIMSPLTPLSDDIQLPPEWSSPQSSRPPSPDETRTLYARPLEEQVEIQEEIEDLCQSVPGLTDEYELLDRLGTGTFSSVYKAVDVNYNNYHNGPWQGTHPANSSAYYQRAGPSYRGRGGRRTTKEDAEEGGDNNHEGVYGGKVLVAIKRIYTTSSPERIRNEVAIMEDCRGARHVSQIITAFRAQDQVVIVLPYQRNMDFRDFFQTLHPEGIKCYFRCLFRALNDIHRRGIIHRDVKPANFLYDPFTGIGTLCDFGLASRMEGRPSAGECLHEPWSQAHPHGQNYHHNDEEIKRIKRAQLKARGNSRHPPEKVGYPENDKRPISKANRAGTRGFRAPEVLLKCGAQTGAIDVWSAGIILLFFLTGKFPIFQSNDDIEGLMEIAVIIGRRKLELAATLHGRIVSTNVPSLENEGINWQTFVERLNPDIATPKKYDMRFYPHNCKHRDGPTSSLRAAQQQQQRDEGDPPAPDNLADAIAEAIAAEAASDVDVESTPALPPPESTATTTASASLPPSSVPIPASHPASTLPSTTAASASDRYANPRAPETHARDLKQVFALLERVLNVEATKRATPEKALSLTWLEEPTIGPDAQFAPLPPGEGVCQSWHQYDAEREVEQVHVRRVCRCSRDEEKAIHKEGAGSSGEGGSDVEPDSEAVRQSSEERRGGDMSSPNPKESALLDVFDDEYQLANEAQAARLPRERCCPPTTLRDLVAGEGIAFGDQPCEFHTDEFFHAEFVYDKVAST
ncbi:hypothetical protein D9619_000232 [Psilocybe cf. subviscida]|uniref:L-glutamate gamma-semialdehyde dehydrogenase n=1 Tax=Psilocybe cf. subviscida TaxID=2480587 RepID=A0A8H5BFX6_9AGAR|nr:hypothetical protein D9619_000232 [Psilocybe cf. subviscida]